MTSDSKKDQVISLGLDVTAVGSGLGKLQEMFSTLSRNLDQLGERIESKVDSIQAAVGRSLQGIGGIAQTEIPEDVASPGAIERIQGDAAPPPTPTDVVKESSDTESISSIRETLERIAQSKEGRFESESNLSSAYPEKERTSILESDTTSLEEASETVRELLKAVEDSKGGGEEGIIPTREDPLGSKFTETPGIDTPHPGEPWPEGDKEQPTYLGVLQEIAGYVKGIFEKTGLPEASGAAASVKGGKGDKSKTDMPKMTKEIEMANTTIQKLQNELKESKTEIQKIQKELKEETKGVIEVKEAAKETKTGFGDLGKQIKDSVMKALVNLSLIKVAIQSVQKVIAKMPEVGQAFDIAKDTNFKATDFMPYQRGANKKTFYQLQKMRGSLKSCSLFMVV